jgi:hypothetical protein
MLGTIGMQAFAERARNELLATGAQVRKRTVETRDDLTAQERQIAGLHAMGLRIRRSVRGCFSARGLLSGICATCSPSSASDPAESWLTHCLGPILTWSRPDREAFGCC